MESLDKFDGTCGIPYHIKRIMNLCVALLIVLFHRRAPSPFNYYSTLLLGRGLEKSIYLFSHMRLQLLRITTLDQVMNSFNPHPAAATGSSSLQVSARPYASLVPPGRKSER